MKHRGHRQHGWSTRRVQGVCAALVLPLALGAGIGVAAPSVVHAQGAQATVGELVEQAQQLEAKKQFEAAAARYEAALKRRPDDDELRGHVARLRSWTGQLDTAVALYRDMLTRTPADIDLRIALARVLSWQKQFQESETLFRDVRAEAPANLDAAQGLADTLTWSGRPAEALPLYEQVHRETHDAELGQRIASIKSELDAEAKAAAQAAAQAAEQERAEASQRAAADQLDKQVVAARELSWKQRYDEAIAGYRAVLAQEPTHYDATRGLADVLGWSGKPAEALPLYEQVYRESHDPEIAQRIAAMKTEIEAGAKVESQRRADETAQSAAADLEQQVVRARELSWQKQYDESIAGYQAVLAKDPQHVEAKQGLADVYYWTGRYAEALPLYQAVYAETKDPELPSRIQAVKTEMAVSIRAPIRRASDGLMIPYRDYLKVGYGHYTYTNKFPDERNLLIEAAKPIGNMTLVGRIEPLNRFGLHDTPLSAELYSPLWRGAWGYIGGSGAFDASFVPVWSLGSEVFQNLGVIAAPLAIFEASMGYKRMEFKTAGIDLLTPGLTLFLPWNLWITEKISYVPAQGSITLSSQLTWRPQERWQFWASYGFGTAGERIRAEQDFARIGSSIWQAGAMFPISSRFSGEVSGYYEDRGFLYVRRGLQLNLIWHW